MVSAPAVRHLPAMRSDGLASPAGFSEILKPLLSMRAITPDTSHMTILWKMAMLYSGRSAIWCRKAFSAVDEMVSTASALVSTLLAPPNMKPTWESLSCSALLTVAVRIEKNSALRSLAWHT